MIAPPLLNTGDKIGITATGRKVSIQDIDTSKKIFASWGMDVITSANIYSNMHSYLAASDKQRLDDFQSMLDNPDIKAIACARGGYGTTRILDSLDFSALYKNPKWIIGFSDITALHLKLFKLGIKSIHGTMPILFSKAESVLSIESLKLCLVGENTMLSASANKKNKQGKVTAQIIGGNLSLIVDSIGTSGDPDTTGKILVIEEVDEYTYKVDRMLTHLKRSNKLNNLAGLIVGHMTDIKEPELPFGETVEEIILNKTRDESYPIAFNFPTGHENPNLAWVHGSVMTLNVTESGSQLLPVH
jgi:muramoyltetrapeptide carboxypeptidase